MSPISSRKMVPLSARSNLPLRWATALVNAPFSWPKSSLSISSSGMAAQLTSIKGFPDLLESRCMLRATNSLPVPFSPVISTHELEGPTLFMSFFRDCMAGERPIISYLASAFILKALFSSRSLLCSKACSAVKRTLSRESGFSIKSYAPSLVVLTAVSMLACPDIMMTGRRGKRAFISFKASTPSIPGSHISSRTRSGAIASSLFNASSALPATATE